ncbi:MAG TPA: four helix bundle protein [Candidatus Nanoarchaeia archaeon]|nr:four helix bundle protein [Candidatus Nanoarchaeia archaeon]
MNKEGKINKFTDLNAWRESHRLVLAIYRVTENFPDKEKFCLISQIRRAAISITSNIAEGFSRESYKDKAYFYSIAKGSLTELQNQLLLSRDVGYISEKEFNKLADQTVVAHKLISCLIKKSKEIYQIHNS